MFLDSPLLPQSISLWVGHCTSLYNGTSKSACYSIDPSDWFLHGRKTHGRTRRNHPALKSRIPVCERQCQTYGLHPRGTKLVCVPNCSTSWFTFFYSAGIDQPLGLWRDVVRDDDIPQGSNGQKIHVRQGDRIFVDLQKSYSNVRFAQRFLRWRCLNNFHSPQT